MAKTKMEPRGRAFDHRGGLLTCNEVGEALGLSEKTIRAWIARRKLPYMKLGRAVRIPAEAVEALIVANIVPAR